ncbi:unnamed protein product [Umbelopsis vinacea]
MTKENKTETMYSLYSNTCESLHQFVLHVIHTAIPIWWQGSTLEPEQWESSDNQEACRRLADYLVYGKPPVKGSTLNEEDLFSSGADATPTWSTEATHNVSADIFSVWLSSNLEFNVLFDILIRSIFWPEAGADQDKSRAQHYLAPEISRPRLPNASSFSNLLTPYAYFALTLHMPLDCLASTSTIAASPHRLIFSSKVDGNSWQNFANKIVNQGAVLLVIKTSESGDIFGGYVDAPLQISTRWTGNQNNYLFRLNQMGVWDAANGTNDHYQYLCWGKKSLPNGFGMGGQFDYCGLWLNADFSHGHSKAGPLCTTYMSPRLSSQEEFIIDQVEAWLVRPIPVDPNNPYPRSQGSVLNHAEEMAFLEMAGRKLYSKDIREADSSDQKQNNISD